ncbi:unnamed protein product, partial [marine sediment metagenome]
ANYELLLVQQLQIHAFFNSEEVAAAYEIVEAGLTGTTPATVPIDTPGLYTVKATYEGKTKTEPVEVVSGQTARVDFHFEIPTPTPRLATFGLAGLGAVIGYALKPEKPVVPMVVGAAAGAGIGYIVDRIRS